MKAPSGPLSLVNVFEVSEPEGHRHYVAFVDPILAGALGLDARWVVGSFEPGPNRGFNLTSFRLNPVFIETFTAYMNEVAAASAELREEASRNPSGWLYVLDPRCETGEGEDAPPSELVGCFAVDGSGGIVPNSFLYNENHRWFVADGGTSGVLSDRRFYDWLHPRPSA